MEPQGEEYLPAKEALRHRQQGNALQEENGETHQRLSLQRRFPYWMASTASPEFEAANLLSGRNVVGELFVPLLDTEENGFCGLIDATATLTWSEAQGRQYHTFWHLL